MSKHKSAPTVIRPYYKSSQFVGVPPVPPIVFLVFNQNSRNRSSLRGPSTIDYDAILGGLKSGDSISIEPLGRGPWSWQEWETSL